MIAPFRGAAWRRRGDDRGWLTATPGHEPATGAPPSLAPT
ncbi:MAG: hypothetical protein AVDCRST_MAG59-3444 [uncultured Thermomicrobiales bacterium]|uniref:Uncharacterized protein n=1 Tax=uncultured Thermomicrobiales bacterium TaxID=1645740 RepID=A0A6J4V5T0_9BACT|nr:MAG: hypothetical protein AVDCRST_MAG59-3444 [uncultured Thermomicrobiales bacterium]